MPSTTHNLYISDGTETASLVTDDVYLLDYVPQTATRQAGAWQDVTESASILIQASTTNLIRYRANAIERLLQQGEDRQSNPAQDRVFAYLQLANEDQLWRSEILGGRVEIDADGLRNWNSRSVEAVVIWTRRYYWEGEEEEIPLATADDYTSDFDFSDLPSVGVDTWGRTGGVVIKNCSSDSWWETNLVNGSIPAAVKLSISPVSQQPVHRYYIGHAVGENPRFDHHFEAETDATGGSTGTVDAALYSSGNYRRVAVTATSLTATMTFSVATLGLGYAGGGYYQTMIRYAGTPPTAGAMNLQARISFGGIELWRGAEVQTSGDCVQSLGTVQLPPSLQNIGYGIYSAVSVVIYARVPSGSVNLDIDYLQFLAAHEARLIEPVTALSGFLIPTLAVDDGIDDGLYVALGITLPDDFRIPAFVGLGQRVTVTPGVRNRYYLQSTEQKYTAGGFTETEITYTIQMWHRPRRLSI